LSGPEVQKWIRSVGVDEEDRKPTKRERRASGKESSAKCVLSAFRRKDLRRKTKIQWGKSKHRQKRIADTISEDDS